MLITTALDTPYGKVAYRKYGQGKRLLIAWHGFGQDSRAFERAISDRDHSCTLYALDLPFHGHTQWIRPEYHPEQLLAVIDLVLQRENRLRFEAVGHSLGARLWISLLPLCAGRMNALYLVAPDGFFMPWAWVTEGTPRIARHLLGRLASRPDKVLALAKALQRQGWLDLLALRYLKHQLDPKRRQRLLQTWYSLSHFPLNRRKAVALLERYNVPTLVLLGQDDQIVPSSRVQPYVEELPSVLVHEEAGNHLSVLSKVAPYLQDGLLPYWQWLRMK
ncbi:MAG TPA: alpha/beta hydrolase [Phaeodactylibacter sp.]|nr:alpha/beta hydrolase [Phaeodactylibacter sp.]